MWLENEPFRLMESISNDVPVTIFKVSFKDGELIMQCKLINFIHAFLFWFSYYLSIGYLLIHRVY